MTPVKHVIKATGDLKKEQAMNGFDNDMPAAKMVEPSAVSERPGPNFVKPREATSIFLDTGKIATAILIAALIIGTTNLYSGRYLATGLGDRPGSIVTDTWLWRTSICHGGGCNDWRTQ